MFFSTDFIQYLQNWGIDLDMLFIFSLSIFIAFVVAYFAIYMGVRYGETLESALDKVSRGRYDLLTKRERRVWDEYEEFKFNMLYK